MAETLTTRLVVDDDATKPTKDYAKLLDGLDGEQATIVLALEGAKAQTELTDILTEVAKLDASDPQVAVELAHAEQVQGELDGIEAKIKELNGTPVEIDTQPTQDGLKNVAKEGDNSRSVLANMVGNSTQDLGELGGVAGTAGVAIGQLGEYAADGNISLSGLAGVAGPMLGLAVATQLISAGMESMSKATESDKKKVDAWRESIEAGEDAAQGLADTLREAGKIEVNREGLFGNSWFGDVADASAAVYNVGLTFDTFSEIVASGKEAIDAWGEQARAAGKDGKSVDYTLDAMNEQLRAQAKAADDAAVSMRLNERSLDSAQKSMVDFIESADPVAQLPGDFLQVASALETVRAGGQLTTDQLAALNEITKETGLTAEEVFTQTTAAMDAQVSSLEANAQAHRDNATAIEGEVSALRAAADTQFALNQAGADFAAKVAELPGILEDPESTLYDIRAALDGVTQSAADVADKTVEMATKQAEASGVTLNAKKQLDLWNKSMLTQASTLTGPARDAVLDYIASVNGITPEKMTDVKAALDKGSVSEAQTALDDVSIARESAVTAEAETSQADRDLDAVANQKRTATIDAVVKVGPIPPLKLPAGTQLSGGAVKPASAGPQTVIVNLPRGQRHSDIARAMSAHTRRAGRRYGAPVVSYARR